ncbi:MAG: porin, partial [Flavobacteriaceae bacterium]|nr:porin [Flavobacteriaceae bacterium]
MKKIIFILFVLVSFKTYAQDLGNGKPNFKIFWNYHNDFTKEVTKKSAFELKRVYLGYKHDFNDTFSAKVTYDIGSNSGGSEYTAYVKIAQLDWKLNPKVKLSMGLIGNKQFNDQESLWGYRYAQKGILNEFKFGPSADLGINSEFTINPKFKINLFILNGEGYKSLQDNNGHQKMGTSFIYNFSEKFTGKIYIDSQRSENTKSIKNNSIFLGYNNSDFR